MVYYYAMTGLGALSSHPGRLFLFLIYEILGIIPLAFGLPKRPGRLGCAFVAALLGIALGGLFGAGLGYVVGVLVGWVALALSQQPVGGGHWWIYGFVIGAIADGTFFVVLALWTSGEPERPTEEANRGSAESG